MEEELHPKRNRIEEKGLLDGAETVSDDLFEIDPADFIDPDEFGQRQPSRTERDTGSYTHDA
jgi:hypothetical protein